MTELREVWRDTRYAVRVLWTHPSLAVGVTATLALGMGANTPVYEAVDWLLFRPPPHVFDPNHLVELNYQVPSRLGPVTIPIGTYPNYLALLANTRSFSDIAVYGANAVTLSLGLGENAEPVRTRLVTASFFRVLGVHSALGRFFARDEDSLGSGVHAAVLSYEFWRRQFAGEVEVIGKTVRLGRSEYTIVGVAPESFGGIDLDVPDVWLPLTVVAPEVYGRAALGPNQGWLLGIARLVTGVTKSQAGAEATSVFRAERKAKGLQTRGSAQLGSVHETLGGEGKARARLALWLAALSGMILLIACANAAGILVSHGIHRRQELALRLALGASRARIVRQLLTESILLGMLGAVGAIIIAVLVWPFLQAYFIPHGSSVHVFDGRAIMLQGAIAGVTVIIAGLVPALHTSKMDLSTALKSGGTASRIGSWRGAWWLLAGQVTLTLMLLSCAGVFLGALRRAQEIPVGFEINRLISVSMDLDALGYRAPSIRAEYDRVQERVRSVPGLEATSLVAGTMFGWGVATQVSVPGEDLSLEGHDEASLISAVSPEYFRTVGERVVHGRGIDSMDTQGSQQIAVVNQTMARSHWPKGDAVGQCLKLLQEPTCREVVGVVEDAHVYSLVEEPHAQVFIPVLQMDSAQTSLWPISGLLVRSTQDPGAVQRVLERAVLAASPGLPYPTVRRVSDRFDGPIRGMKIGLFLLSAAGGLALILAAVGVYGTQSLLVARRTPELAIRIALGADPRSIARLVLRAGLRVLVAGLIAGAVGTLVLNRALASVLYGLGANGPLPLLLSGLVLLFVGLFASLIPARRASRVVPMIALQER